MRVGPSRRSATRARAADTAADEAFANAREPLAQAFEPVADGEAFLVVVNHFKSKGSAGPSPGDADTGDGQGASTVAHPSGHGAARLGRRRVQRHATTCSSTGDFNSYTQEDPMQVLYDAGYTRRRVRRQATTSSRTSFAGLSGSLDHVLANDAAWPR